ncbi:MAG: DUF3796 domain-containing protein [Lachnospiraceae bacterium]|nr:DUF3796 domain-containing protein [Lachnospiraceae bacterium]
MKKKVKIIIGLGVVCLLMVLGASWYAVTFNDSRLVVPMEAPYQFTVRDLPMLIAVGCMVLYLFFLLALCYMKGKKDETAHVTRRISPKLGIMGLLGFLGFMGFWTYSADGRITPFVYFMFFGFFSFFYEGRMSNAYMDERYEENKYKAKLKAHGIALDIVYAALFFVVAAEGRILKTIDVKLMILVIAVACSMAVDVFLSEYLLYRYDHADELDESEE